jgi:predicted lysophospholipase L1 biosynthesis ABC-type transport system permease subunit
MCFAGINLFHRLLLTCAAAAAVMAVVAAATCQAELQSELSAYGIHTQAVDRYIVTQSRQVNGDCLGALHSHGLTHSAQWCCSRHLPGGCAANMCPVVLQQTYA